MSSLVISGDTSGSVTLSAPAVAGTTTITLPSTSGTLASIASVNNNGVVYANSSGQPTTSTGFVFDGTNLGLGVTPSAWYSSYKALQVKTSSLAAWGNNEVYFMSNAYGDTSSTYKYLATGSKATSYVQYEGTHIWQTAGTGTAGNTITFTQAMTLDASGRLLVGGTSSVSGGPVQAWINGTGTSFQTNSAVFGALATVAGREIPMIYASDGTNSGLISSLSGNMGFFTQAAERMRLDSSGNLLVGATTQPGTDRVYISKGNDRQLYLDASTSGNGVYTTISFANQGAIKTQMYWLSTDSRFYVQNPTGGVYLASSGTSWTSNSDERLKDIIEPITNAANKVSTLRAVIGKYKTDEEGKRRSFLIAQDVQAVLPEAVDADDPEKLGVSYTDVIPLLVAAIKEQQAIIQQLQADVLALKGTQP